MTFIITLLLLALVTMGIPLFIIRKVYEKKQVVRRIIILPFFFLGWLLQAFLAVVFYDTMSYTCMTICDWSVVVMPIIATCIAYPVCGADRPF